MYKKGLEYKIRHLYEGISYNLSLTFYNTLKIHEACISTYFVVSMHNAKNISSINQDYPEILKWTLKIYWKIIETFYETHQHLCITCISQQSQHNDMYAYA